MRYKTVDANGNPVERWTREEPHSQYRMKQAGWTYSVKHNRWTKAIKPKRTKKRTTLYWRPARLTDFAGRNQKNWYWKGTRMLPYWGTPQWFKS